MAGCPVTGFGADRAKTQTFEKALKRPARPLLFYTVRLGFVNRKNRQFLELYAVCCPGTWGLAVSSVPICPGGGSGGTAISEAAPGEAGFFDFGFYPAGWNGPANKKKQPARSSCWLASLLRTAFLPARSVCCAHFRRNTPDKSASLANQG
jgi:hypothetical protein